MAMPLTALYFLGFLAILTSFGLFIDFGDQDTNIVLSFVASVLWAIFGVASFDVRTVTTFYATKSESILPFAYIGIALAIGTFLLTMYMVVTRVGSEVESSELEDVMR